MDFVYISGSLLNNPSMSSHGIYSAGKNVTICCPEAYIRKSKCKSGDLLCFGSGTNNYQFYYSSKCVSINSSTINGFLESDYTFQDLHYICM